MTLFDVFFMLGFVGGAILGGWLGFSVIGGFGALLGAFCGFFLGAFAGRLPFLLAAMAVRKDISQKTPEDIRGDLRDGVWPMRHIWIGELAARGKELHSYLEMLLTMLKAKDPAMRYQSAQILSAHFPELTRRCEEVQWPALPPMYKDPPDVCEREACHDAAERLTPIVEQLMQLNQECGGIGTKAALSPLLDLFEDEAEVEARGDTIRLALQSTIRRLSLTPASRDMLLERLATYWQERPQQRPLLPSLASALATPAALQQLNTWAETPDLTEETMLQLQDATTQLTQRLSAEVGLLSLAPDMPSQGALSQTEIDH